MPSLSEHPPQPAERWSFLEDSGTDFPFYNGVPAPVRYHQWALILAAVVFAFLLLALSAGGSGGLFWSFLPGIGLAAIPLWVFARVAPGHWTCLFGRIGLRELRLMLGFALLNIVVSMGLGAIVMLLTHVSPNSSAAQLEGLDALGRVAFFAKTAPQLLGEEVITLLPFLAMLQWLTHSPGWGRRRAVLFAWLGTAVLFGLLHLPTYDWNWVQCIVVIGGARLVLTLAWIKTKNLWVSTGAHIANDWILFGMALWGSGLASQALF